MSLFKMFRGGGKLKKKSSQHQEIEKLSERRELLMEKKEDFKKKIEQEILFAKKNSRSNRRALQALRRKMWYEKHLSSIECAVSAIGDVVYKVNNLIRDITEAQDVTRDMSGTFYTSLNFPVEFNEVQEELMAELERLEKYMDIECIFEKNLAEGKVPCTKLLSPASLPPPAKMEEDELEEDLEYLRYWANEP
ncbi:charged multivesicular body protein 4b-like [Echeneis naucrates]|uniref:charged multivesicular body protein 4b-like n=1 Tax=Echeneis naucrates TaxID=173247 RepID=UPI0011139256|nr:charged multivesicular body protein 4b-like [Echeneis naucrates]